MSWQIATLEECCYSITDGPHAAPPKSQSGSVPFVMISNMNPTTNQFDFSNASRVGSDFYNSLAESRKSKKGDTLLSVVGSLGIPIFITSNDPLVFQRHIAILKPKEMIEPQYLYYSLKNPAFTYAIETIAMGAAQKTLALNQLRGLKILLPDIHVQKRIVSVLSAYDNLIANNQKQIKLLEEAAQRLYKEWFINLRFPGHEHTHIANGLPDGWTECSLADICTVIKSGGTPSRKKSNYWLHGNINWFKTKELLDAWLIDSEEMVTPEGLSSSSANVFPTNTVLMAIYASPTLGRLGILSNPAACNQAALGLIANHDFVSTEWLYLMLFELRDDFNSVARGTGQQNISAEIVKNWTIVLPPFELVQRFTSFVRPLFGKRLKLQLQISTLTEARDRLLPKLMSEEIEV